MKLYDAVRSANVSKQRTVGATRGAILARGSAGVPLLVEQLQSSDKAFFNIALRTARELPGPEVAKALLAEMERATPQRQSYLLLALADRGDTEALPTALKAAKSGPVPQRLVAIGVLEHIGNSSCIPVLMAIAAESEVEVAQAAKSALIRLPGADVDAAVVAMLKQSDENARRAALELVAQRRLTSAMPQLLKAAEDASPAISTASLRALGELAGEGEIPALINILMKAKQTGAAESALSAVSARLARPVSGSVVIQKAVYGDLPDGPQADVTAKMADLVKTGAASMQASNKNFGDPAGGRVKKLRVEYTVNGIPGSKTVRENDSITFTVSAPSPAFVDALCAAMGRAPTSGKLALLRVLRSAGGPKALTIVRTAMNDSNNEIKETAFSALCQWPTEDALPDLARLAKDSSDPRQKILALRGYIRLIGEADMEPEKKMALLKDAMPLVQRDDERKLALGALGSVASPDALAMVLPQIGNAALKEEACAAAVSIGEKIVASNKDVTVDAMKQVLQAKPNDEVVRRARFVLREASGGKPAAKAGRGKGARK
jgi:HEAT repeat protein